MGRFGIAFACGALVVIAFGCWLAFQANEAKSSLEATLASVLKAREALSNDDPVDAARWVENSEFYANKAREATRSFPFTVASGVPWLGSPFETTGQISDVVVALIKEVLKPALGVGATVAPDRLIADGRLDLPLLRSSEPTLSTLSAAAGELEDRADAIPEPAYLDAVRGARASLQAQLSDLAGVLDSTSFAAQLAPTMMGGDGPRTYLLAFQTNAEARGTGGLAGGFELLRFDDGRAMVDSLGSTDELDTARAQVDLGPDFAARYGFVDPMGDFRNSNLSSHFPYAAQIWASMWQQQAGRPPVDGVIAIDPVAMSYILATVGPVTMPDGELITSDNVVELTESTAYIRFANDDAARTQYLQDVGAEVVKKMTGSLQSSREMLKALGKAVGEGRLAVWSASPAEQQVLEKTPVAHVIPTDPAPYAEVVINNLGGNKLDYYLGRALQYTAGSCDEKTRRSTITVRLSNSVPDTPLPDDVVAEAGVRPDIPIDLPAGTSTLSIALVATDDSRLRRVLVNGKRAPVFTGTERGHPTFEVRIAVPRGQTAEIQYDLMEPTAPGSPRMPVQPLRENVALVMSVPKCAN